MHIPMAKDFVNRENAQRASNRGGGSSARRKSTQRRTSPRKSTRKTRRKGSAFHGASFSAGIVLGAGIVLVAAYAPELFQDTIDRAFTQQRAQPKQTVEFQFDERLRNQEVTANPGTYSNAADPAPGTQLEYLIQAASFQLATDADTLRAQLLLSGLPAKTNGVTVGDKPWYRVTVGPFPNSTDSRRAMTKLRALDLDAFLIKREVKASQ